MTTESNANSRTTRSHWNQTWDMPEPPKPLELSRNRILDFPQRGFNAYYHSCFEELDPQAMSLLEVGCANSLWLPRFATEFGFTVAGIDYSEIGCAQARKILARAGVIGEITCADLFYPPPHLLEKFDVVFSFGVAEHFESTQSCIAAMARFLKPGGYMLTVVPNMVGWVGTIQKTLNSDIFRMHNPLDRASLSIAHSRAGMQVLSCDYFLFTKFSVCNLGRIKFPSFEWIMKKPIWYALSLLSVGIWMLEKRFGQIRPNWRTSPYINCFAVKAAVN